MGQRYKIMLMDPGPERDKLSKENGFSISVPQYSNKPPPKFMDEANHAVRSKGDPENKHKSELQIEKELQSYLTSKRFKWWPMKIKGEIQSIGHGLAVMKKSQNRGFPDILCCIRGLWVGIEVKKPGGLQSVDQVQSQREIESAGGIYIISTSIRELEASLKQHKLI